MLSVYSRGVGAVQPTAGAVTARAVQLRQTSIAPRVYALRRSSSATWQIKSAADDEPEATSAVSVEDASQPRSDAAPPANGSAIAGVAVGLGIGLFAATRLLGGAPTLATLQAGAIPFDAALANSKPTIVEFYANWCETCREMTSDTFEVESKFAGDVNFVMLNIDNSKWGEEMEKYNVNGIPEYVFLDGSGKEKAIAVGRVPRQVLLDDAQALADGEETLPYAAVKRAASALQAPPGAVRGSTSAPRDHS